MYTRYRCTIVVPGTIDFLRAGDRELHLGWGVVGVPPVHGALSPEKEY